MRSPVVSPKSPGIFLKGVVRLTYGPDPMTDASLLLVLFSPSGLLGATFGYEGQYLSVTSVPSPARIRLHPR